LICATVRRSIAEAANEGDLGRLPADVWEHLDRCPKCAEEFYARIETWDCPQVRAYVQRYAITSVACLPERAQAHVAHCRECDHMLEQTDRLSGMLTTTTLAAEGLHCPAVAGAMMPRPVTWKLALAVAFVLLSFGLLAMTVFRTATHYGWFTELPAPPTHCGNCPECENGASHGTVK
jgi:hypothetical protein